jgi:hypothetical protein
MIPHFSELDEAQKPGHQEPKPTLHSCIKKVFEDCKQSNKPIHDHELAYGDCLFIGFILCQHTIEHSIFLQNCISACWVDRYEHDRPFAHCLEDCYKRHVKKHPNKSHPNNP